MNRNINFHCSEKQLIKHWSLLWRCVCVGSPSPRSLWVNVSIQSNWTSQYNPKSLGVIQSHNPWPLWALKNSLVEHDLVPAALSQLCSHLSVLQIPRVCSRCWFTGMFYSAQSLYFIIMLDNETMMFNIGYLYTFEIADITIISRICEIISWSSVVLKANGPDRAVFKKMTLMSCSVSV